VPPAFANKRDFWITFTLTAITGILLGLLALCYLNFVEYFPRQWTDNFEATKTSSYFTCDSSCSYDIDDVLKNEMTSTTSDPCPCDKYKNYDFYMGKKHWIAVPVIAAFLISLIRHFSNYPDKIPGLYEEMNRVHVDYKWAPYTFAISAISLAGG
jgi:hypothetical protein